MQNQNSPEIKKIKVDQTLHGYEGGHRLIESSRSVPADSDRKMHILSDMSGASLVRGFEDYFTGYALPEIGCYVLARTWYADEMDRPGCVWTHSLLIDQDDIGSLKTHNLIHHFQRPEDKGGRFKEYSRILEVKSTSRSERKPDWPESLRLMDDQKTWREQRQLAKLVLVALYKSPDNPVFLEARRSSEYQWLPLRIWDQQWPSLRTEFSFCTGAIDGREIQGDPLDLQIVPSKRVRSLKNKFRGCEFISYNYNDDSDTESREKWIDISVKDIVPNNKSRLSEFFDRYDPNVRNGRSVFVPLVNIYKILYGKEYPSKNDLIDIIHLLSENFSGQREAYNLKEKYLRKVVQSSYSCDMLSVLCSKEAGDVFEPGLLKSYLTKSEYLKACSKREILLGIIKPESNEVGERVVEILVCEMEIEKLLRAIKDNPKLLHDVLSARPELVEETEFWKEEYTQCFDREVAVLVEETLESGAKLSSVIGAIMEAGRTRLASDLVRNGGEEALIAFLNWANQADEFDKNDLDWSVRSKIRSSPSYVEAWLEQCEGPRANLISFIADLLSPNRLKVKNTGPMVWVQAARSVSNSKLKRKKYIQSLSFILVLGFDAEKGKPVIVSTFQPVHDAAASDDLNPRTRSWLRDVLAKHTRPSLGDVFGWDYCAKLRQALVSRWLDEEWPKTELLDAVTEADTLRRTLSLISRTEEGDDWIEQLKQELRNQSVDLDKETLSVLK